MSKHITFALTILLASLANPLSAQKQSINNTLYKTISEQGIDAGIQQYHQLKKEAANEYKFAETDLNVLGYRLIAENKHEAAIAMLKLNTEIYPKSPNAFDSLGEAYLRAGDSEKAIKYYELVLKMAPKTQLDDKTRSFIETNAASKLAYLNSSESKRKSTMLEDFLSNSEHPYGRLHPDAPPETELWGQLCRGVAMYRSDLAAKWPVGAGRQGQMGLEIYPRWLCGTRCLVCRVVGFAARYGTN